SEPGSREEQRRQHNQKNDIGIQHNSRNAGDKTEQQSRDDQHDGIGCLQLARQSSEACHEKHEQENNDLRRLNAAMHQITPACFGMSHKMMASAVKTDTKYAAISLLGSSGASRVKSRHAVPAATR